MIGRFVGIPLSDWSISSRFDFVGRYLEKIRLSMIFGIDSYFTVTTVISSFGYYYSAYSSSVLPI